jgi:aminoglycoside N3'-acetyltransferase
VRSDNPTHSVAAIGARAAELAGEHGNSTARPCCFHADAFGSESPWQKLYEWNAAYCFIGVDFTVATMRHFVECLLVEDLLNQVPPERRDALRAQLASWYTEGVWPHHNSQKLSEHLTERGHVRLGKIGSATLRCVRAQDWVNQSLRILRAEPGEWFPEEFMAWMEEATAWH